MQKQKMAWSLTEEADDFETIIPLFAKYTPTPLPSGIRAKRAVRQLLAFLNPRPHDTSVAESTNDFLGLLRQYRHIALEGSSGSGKTTTLRQIETSLLRRRTPDSPLIPLRIDVDDWIAADISFHIWFQEYLLKMGLSHIPLSKLAVLIDGIQEFDNDQSSVHHGLIRSISDNVSDIYCVVTAQSFPLDAVPSDFLAARLEPLSGAQTNLYRRLLGTGAC
jgi:hypothetical protein